MRRYRRHFASLLTCSLVWLCFWVPALARPDLAVHMAPSLPASVAEALSSALQAEVPELSASPESRGPRANLIIESTAEGLLLRLLAEDGKPLMEARAVEGPFDEATASEVASIVHALLVGLQAAEQQASTVGPGNLAPASAAPSKAPNKAAAASGKPAQEPQPAKRALATLSAPRPQRLVVDELPPAERRRRRAQWLRAGLLYTGSNVASELPWQSGVRAEVDVGLLKWLYAGLNYAYSPALTLGDETTHVQLTGNAAALLLGVQRALGRWDVGADVSAAITHTRRRTAQTVSWLQGTDRSSAWTESLALRFHVRPRIRRFAIDVAPALEVGLRRQDLVVDTGGDPRTLLSPRLFRARLDVGASFDLL